MKKIFLAVLLLISCSVWANTTPQKSYNVLTDIKSLLSSSLNNSNGDSTHGDAALLQAILDYNHSNRKDSALQLDFPANCKLRLDSTIYPYNNVTFNFLPNSQVVSTSSLGTADLFAMYGRSNVKFIGMNYTNYFASFINSVVHYTASPNQCTGNKVINCSFKNIWASAAILLANAQDTDSTFWLAGTEIIGDTIVNNYNPSSPHMTFNDYGTNKACHGINVLNCYRGLHIAYCYIWNCGGDGIYGYGLSKAMSHDPQNGHIETDHCNIGFCNMDIEINGNYYPWGDWFHHNSLGGTTTAASFNISTGGKGLRIDHNDMYNYDAGSIEAEAEGGNITDNNCYIYRWQNTTQGVQKAAYGSGNNRCWNVNIYGFANTIKDNYFFCDPTNPTSNSPAEIDGLLIAGKAPGNDTAYDRNSYQGYSDYPSFYNIDNNWFIGHTNRVLDLTICMTREVSFTNNHIISQNNTGADNICMIYGYKPTFTGNTFNLTGSGMPQGSNAVIKKRSQQTDGAGEVVHDNTIIGSFWYSSLYKYKQL